MELIYIILSSLSISLFSLIGGILIVIKKTFLNKILLILISISAGTMLGGAFIHLLPEAFESLSFPEVYLLTLISFSTFFIIEKVLLWHHCHNENCHKHTFSYLNLIGDSIHNFIDGLIITAAFITDIKIGLVTSIAIALHEIPQELGDLGVLIYSGFKVKRALITNFLVSLMILVGSVSGLIFSHKIEHITTYLLPIAAGSFIYIATSDLLPEIKKEGNIIKSFIYFMFFLCGNIFMYIIKILFS